MGNGADKQTVKQHEDHATIKDPDVGDKFLYTQALTEQNQKWVKKQTAEIQNLKQCCDDAEMEMEIMDKFPESTKHGEKFTEREFEMLDALVKLLNQRYV